MAQLIVFDHITLDGYFAGLNGDINFLRQRFKDDEFHSFAVENINAAGALLFGRVTYRGVPTRKRTGCPLMLPQEYGEEGQDKQYDLRNP
jgi:dihydrofolate reductase